VWGLLHKGGLAHTHRVMGGLAWCNATCVTATACAGLSMYASSASKWIVT
jgi:hypothetical protein